jgi:hypothetical protein
MDQGVPTLEVGLHWIHPGPLRPFTSIPLLSALAVPARKRRTHRGAIPPTGGFVPFKWQAGVAGQLGVQVPINVKATSPRFEHCCSRRGKRPS